ncbi:hypothetical protein VPHD479_0425 [Vibrio phage D479]
MAILTRNELASQSDSETLSSFLTHLVIDDA